MTSYNSIYYSIRLGFDFETDLHFFVFFFVWGDVIVCWWWLVGGPNQAFGLGLRLGPSRTIIGTIPGVNFFIISEFEQCKFPISPETIDIILSICNSYHVKRCKNV